MDLMILWEKKCIYNLQNFNVDLNYKQLIIKNSFNIY